MNKKRRIKMDNENENVEKTYSVRFFYTQEVIIPGSIEVVASSEEEAKDAAWEKHCSGEINIGDYLEDSYANDSEFNISECEEIK
jgi:hypothetical protein